MSFRKATAVLLPAALVTAVAACTPSAPARTAKATVEADPVATQREAAKTDWRAALAETLSAAEQARWDDVNAATSWAWPEMADYRLYYRARALEYAFQFTEAAGHYARLVSEAPQSLFAAEARERKYLALASTGEARAYLAEAKTWARTAVSSSETARRAIVLGKLYEAAGATTEAVEAYRTVRINYPAHAAAAEAEAHLAALDAAGHGATALSREERIKRANALFASRAYDTAFEAFGEMLSDTDDKAEQQEYLAKRGQARFFRRRYPEALTLLRKAASISTSSESRVVARFYEAYALSRLGQAADSENAYQQIVNRDAKRFPEWAAKAQFKIINLQEGNNERAAKHFKKYIDDYPRGESRPEALWWLAWAHYNRGNYTAAGDAFEKRAAYGDDLARAASYWQARTAEKLGRKEEANKRFADIAAKAPLHYYGLLSSVRLEALAAAPVRAKFFAHEATFETEAPAAFHLVRANALAEIRRTQEAERELQAAAQAAKSREQIYAISRAMVAAGRYNAAQRAVWSTFEPELLRADVFYTDLWEIAYPRAFAEIVGSKAADQGTNPHIVLALMREESRYRPDVASPANAYGLLQLILPTAKRVASRLGLPAPTEGDLYNPELNITLGTAYIKSLLDAYRNNFFLAFAGYNGGPLNVNRWLEKRKGSDWDEFVENIPYTETRNYVKKVTTSLLRYQYLYEPEQMVSLSFLTASVTDGDRADGVE
jgi:soluble lytic murein transglycosylase